MITDDDDLDPISWEPEEGEVAPGGGSGGGETELAPRAESEPELGPRVGEAAIDAPEGVPVVAEESAPARPASATPTIEEPPPASPHRARLPWPLRRVVRDWSPRTWIRRWRRPAARWHDALLLAIAAFAALLRAQHVAWVVYSPFADMISYIKMAESVFEHWRDQWHLFPPAYPFFLFVLLSGNGYQDLSSILPWQVFLDVVTLFAVAKIARYTFGARTGLIVAFLYAIADINVFNTALVMSEVVSQFLVVGAILFFVHWWRRPGIVCLAWVAVLVAAAAHVRTNNLVLLGPIGLWALLRFVRGGWSAPGVAKGLASSAAFAALVFALLVPWSLRTSRVLGAPALLASNTGLLLLMGNNPYYDGTYLRMETLPPEVWDPIIAMPHSEQPRAMQHAAVDLVATYPWHYILRTLPRRFEVMFQRSRAWNQWPWDDALEGNYYTHPLGPYLWMPLVFGLWFYWPGILGLAFVHRRMAWFLAAMFAANLVTVVIVPAIVRYRYPADLYVLVGTGALLGVVLRRDRWWRAALLATPIVLVVCAVGSLAFNGARFGGLDLAIGPTATPRVGTWRELTSSPQGQRFQPAPRRAGEEIVVPLADLRVDPRQASHALVRFEFRIETADEDRGRTIDLRLEYLDAAGKEITRQRTAPSVLAANEPVNRWMEEWHTAWRVVFLPPDTHTLRLSFVSSLRGTVEVRHVEVRVPVWYEPPAGAATP